MRKKALPIGVLFMVLVVLLAAVGVSYGYWTEDITAKANLDTGDLDVYWYSASTDTTGSTPGQASCSAAVHSTNNNRLDIALTDVHPGFQCAYTAYVYNNGTVPVEVQVSTSDISQDSGYVFDSSDFTMVVGPCDGPIYPGQAKACTGSFKLKWSAGNDTQNQSASYTVTVHAVQWKP
jgi:hypothetical protein